MSSDDRWAEARSRTDEPLSTEDRTRLQRQERAFWWVVGVVLLLAVTAGVVTGEVAPGAVTGVARAIFGTGMLLAAVGLIVSVRSGRSGRSLSSPLMALPRVERMNLLRTVQGREPADPTHLDVARALAERQCAPSPGLPLLTVGLSLFIVSGLVAGVTGGRIGIAVALALLLGGGLAFRVRQARRARRFLADHPARPGDSGGEQ